ncbi:hypothetical protein K432DRAFT_292628 [Lepidopterella palustris CBS 459.81]|uniref:25S rRNA adenine-N(1) methyltransferase n=1 Tax=Lepidopterella palustris CBS 459.81 TaxID=1314670 RepID=A0A8E2EF93_9PEZI|nr:hypothetical protein K432DRAFT_292628 [Lepidopterella palustris CBS 459.81]
MPSKSRQIPKYKPLSHGRPPLLSKKKGTPRSFTSKATRSLIRTHHHLQKQHAAALKASDTAKAQEIEKAIARNGGLELYQAASIKGQSAERGGDSSRILVKWLQEGGLLNPLSSAATSSDSVSREKNVSGKVRHKVLEIGALSTSNAIARFAELDVTRIDLHSQDPAIETQNFMQRPVPASSLEMFDIISLSLVLNYVQDASSRGQMLRRTCDFLLPPEHTGDATGTSRSSSADTQAQSLLPALFLVLPAPCVTNSRYLTEEHLTLIMQSLGYVRTHKKLSPKLVYYLWRYEGERKGTGVKVLKKVLRDGGGRNNFCIILE